MESIFPSFVIVLFWIVIFAMRRMEGGGSHVRNLSQRADAYAAEGNFSLEEQTLQALIRKTEKKNGSDAIEVGIYLRRLARSKVNQGQNAAAILILQRVLSIQELNLGPQSRDLVQTLDWLAHLYRCQNDLDSCLAQLRRMVTIATAAYGENDRLVGAFHNHIGRVLHQKGDASGAVDSFRRALAIHEQSQQGNEKGPTTELVVSLNNLGIVLGQQNQLEEAEPLLRRALSIQERTLPADSPELVPTLVVLGELLWKKRKYDDAERCFAASLKFRRSLSVPKTLASSALLPSSDAC